ncbi:ribosome biogenesis GTPase Der [Ammonifex thiophilus]|uniref:GTPase Der n=1 Tax=Ammonifex thiophilus TaxID=444093 RepID=A0A3D8P4E5_9THEO|nr:ribosome biogenesis GTPase Der [Ammonifex thiophilus]RDV84005.1 ribosome biogenesis GTPase Der [Ammonifex thiophilus]
MGRPVVVIVGRPNVGKSTLFNRLVGKGVAIVEEEPGVTRDRLYREVEWCGRTFVLVDTGGVVESPESPLGLAIRRQVEQALEEADVVLFVVDYKTGVTSEDQAIASMLRRTGKPILLVVNKVDKFDPPPVLSDFYALGLGTEPIPVSAAQGLNVGDLLDAVIDQLPPEDRKEERPEVDAVAVAIVGRPNVGKSSLVNALLGEERVIVSDIPGTTRDAVDTFLTWEGKPYVLIDTAGLRRRSRIKEEAERQSCLRARQALKRAHAAVLVLDGAEGVTMQDKRIAGLIEEAGRAVVIAVNKWDLVPSSRKDAPRYLEALRRELYFIDYAPVVFTVATEGFGVTQILTEVERAVANARRRVREQELREVVEEAQLRNPPPRVKDKRLEIYRAYQVAVEPPVFLLQVNDPELMTPYYRKYLENQLRAAFDFTGTPIRFVLRRHKKGRGRNA